MEHGVGNNAGDILDYFTKKVAIALLQDIHYFFYFYRGSGSLSIKDVIIVIKISINHGIIFCSLTLEYI